MTTKQLTQRQLTYLERLYESRLKRIKVELKIRRAKHGSGIKLYKTIKT